MAACLLVQTYVPPRRLRRLRLEDLEWVRERLKARLQSAHLDHSDRDTIRLEVALIEEEENRRAAIGAVQEGRESK